MEKILVSFNHNVAAVIDGRILSIWCAVCEEIFGAQTAMTPKQEAGTVEAEHAKNAIEKMTADFPIMLRVLSLGDGKPLSRPMEIMVKWSNISALCNFQDSWIKPSILEEKPAKVKKERKLAAQSQG